MKKSLYLISVALLGFLSLTACGQKESNGNKEENNNEQQDTTPKKTITYRSWDYGTEAQNNEERQLVAAFEKAENVKVKIVENIVQGDGYWDGVKASIINKIDLADVMMIPNLDQPLAAQYLLNIKEYADADPEFATVNPSIREACTFKNGIYAVPARLNLQGYYANTTLLGQIGVETRGLNCSSPYSVIEEIIQKASAVQGVVALSSAAHYIDTMASVFDESGQLGYFTWDGEKYNLDSQAFIRGVQAAKEIFEAKKSLDAYTVEDLEAINSDTESPLTYLWNNGKLALRYGYTYEAPDIVENNQTNNSYAFIGNPGGKVTIVGDYYGIYKETKEPELAYKFAKWMSFGKQGFSQRMELYKEKGAINTLPMVDDDDLVEKYFEYFGDSSTLRGLANAYDYCLTKGMVEGTKVIPGYNLARYNKKTGIKVGETENATMFFLLDACYKSGDDITKYTSGSTNINTIANSTYTNWLNLYGGNYE